MTEAYRSLAREFHADRSSDSFRNHEVLARTRLEADSTFRTGISTSLGELFVATPRQTSLLSERILLAERDVAQLWRSMPRVIRRNYIRHYISEEIFATNEMEGVRSTRKETETAVREAEKAQANGDSEKTFRFIEFAKLYLNLSDRNNTFPNTLDEIRNIYDKIALNEIDDADKPDGILFRAQDVEVQGAHGQAIHAGVSGENRIGILLTEMINLAHSNTMPGMYNAIVCHFLFEYIHPFYDGNGRTGRYLLAQHLNEYLSLPTVLSLSRVIAENKNTYYKAFTEAEDKLNCGELTFFVNTMLSLIAKAQDEFIDLLGVKTDQMNKAKVQCDELEQEHGLSRHATEILYRIMLERLFDPARTLTLDELSEQLELSKQSVRKYVAELDSAGLVSFPGRRPLKLQSSSALTYKMEGA